MSSSKIGMSEIDLSKEGVVHFAHYVIQTMQCEWEGCTTTLNSWDTLAKVINNSVYFDSLPVAAGIFPFQKTPSLLPDATQNPATFLCT